MKKKISLKIIFLSIAFLLLATGVVFAERDIFVFASAEPLTGNWDPSSHTILSQIGIETHIFDKLYAFPCGADNPGKAIPALAIDYKYIDELTLEFTLRQGVKFHDGSDFDAEDVKATLDYYSDPNKPGFGWLPGALKTKVVDSYTVHVVTEKPLASLFYSLGLVPMLSKEDIDRDLISEHPNGTGPWLYDRQIGETTMMKANPNYWAGPPKLKEFHWIYVPNASTRLFGLLGGDYDVVERVEAEHIATIEEKPSTKICAAPSVENKWLIFRCHKPPFDNALVRKAISYAVDRDGIVSILGASGNPVDAHVPPAKFGYATTPNNIKYNPKKAIELLKEAGYADISKFPTIDYITSTGFYPKTREYAEYIASTLGEIGIKVNLRVFETSPWLESLYNPEAAHMIDTGWCSGTPEPDQIIRTMFHQSVKRMTFFDDDEMSASLDKEQREVDMQKRYDILANETLPLLMEKVPALPLFNSVMIWGYNDRVKNFRGWPSNNFYLKDFEEPFGEMDVYKETE